MATTTHNDDDGKIPGSIESRERPVIHASGGAGSVYHEIKVTEAGLTPVCDTRPAQRYTIAEQELLENRSSYRKCSRCFEGEL